MNRSLKNFRFSLKLKIALVFLLLVVVIMAIVGYIFTIHESNLRVKQVKERMERLARNIATIRSVETEDWDVYQNYIDNQIKVNPDIIYIAIFDENGELKVHSLNSDWLDLERPRTLTKLEQANIVLRLDQRQIAAESQRDIESQSVNIIVGNQNLGTVNIGFSLVELNDEMRRNLYRNLLLDILFMILAMIISLLISSRIVNPLGKLTQAMEKISQGDLDQEIYIHSHDEIGDMANTFNFMATGLRQKQVIENFNRELAFSLELEKVATLMAERITSAVNANQTYIFLQDIDNSSQLNLIASCPMAPENELTLSKNTLFCDYINAQHDPVRLREIISKCNSFDPLRNLRGVTDEALFWPLIIKDKAIGFLILSQSKQNIPYSDDEIKFLKTLVAQGSFAIENALLYLALTEQERLKRELEIARSVQLSLLPQQNPLLPGLDIDGICIPAMEIGGDYYDYFEIDDHTIGIVVADVTGKGTSAAFYMAMVKGMMISLSTIYPSPRQFLRELNRRIYGIMDRRVFVTMLYATIDLRKKVLRFARAGHQSLLVLNAHDSRVEAFTPRGLGVGLAHDSLFDQHISEQKIQLTPGDIVLFYTDGISEAMNHDLEEFGEQRLLEVLVQQRNQTAQQIRNNIISAVNKFVQLMPQHDDITLVAVKAI